MKEHPASRKVNEQGKEIVAAILFDSVSDPRLDMVTVTGAEVSRDRSVMNVYVSSAPERYEEVLAGLESAKGRIRSELGQRITWRVTPELRFFIDESVDEARRIQEFLTDVPPTMRDRDESDEDVAVDASEDGETDD